MVTDRVATSTGRGGGCYFLYSLNYVSLEEEVADRLKWNPLLTRDVSGQFKIKPIFPILLKRMKGFSLF